MKREFLLTVDVEALPGRARDRHVEKLIWGRFPGTEQTAGLAEMLNLGSDFGVPLTCFLDMAEVHLYGDQVRHVGRVIHESGHDLQLHLHPELLPESYWTSKGLTKPHRTQEFYGIDRARVVMHDFVEQLRELKDGAKIAAYRAGAFRIGRNMLIAQREAGIPISSNLSYETFRNQARAPLSAPEARVFMWDIGVWELPVTQVWQLGSWRVLALPMQVESRMGNIGRLFEVVNNSEVEGPVVMILHSWSLLGREQGSKVFAPRSETRVRRFRRILEEAARLFEPITMSDMAERLRSGSYANRETLEFPAVDGSR